MHTHIFRIEKSDRYITILTDGSPQGGRIIGMNFQQGLDEPPTSIDTDYELTDYVNKRLDEEDYSLYLINSDFDRWLAAIDLFIWEWWNKQNEPSLQLIPVPILNDVFSEIEESIISIEEHLSDMGDEDLNKLQSLKRFIALMTDTHGVYVKKSVFQFVKNITQ